MISKTGLIPPSKLCVVKDFAVEKAQSKLNMLDHYTRPKVLKQLQTEVEKARSNELEKQRSLELAKNSESHLREAN